MEVLVLSHTASPGLVPRAQLPCDGEQVVFGSSSLDISGSSQLFRTLQIRARKCQDFALALETGGHLLLTGPDKIKKQYFLSLAEYVRLILAHFLGFSSFSHSAFPSPPGVHTPSRGLGPGRASKSKQFLRLRLGRSVHRA